MDSTGDGMADFCFHPFKEQKKEMSAVPDLRTTLNADATRETNGETNGSKTHKNPRAGF
jgi:hypothetical protein